MTHLLLPSTVTRKLLIAQASYCRITKLRARLTPKCKKLKIRKCGIVPGFCRSGHIYTHTTLTLKIKGNYRCIYLIYPIVMATGVRYIYILSSWQRDIFEIYPVVMATGVLYVPLLWQYAWVHFRNIPFLVNSMYDKFPILYTI